MTDEQQKAITDVQMEMWKRYCAMKEKVERLHEVNAELVEALSVVIRGVPDTWDGVKQAKAALTKAQGDGNG